MNLESIRKEIISKFSTFEDPNFSFDKESHTYTYLGEKFDSVTSYIKRFKTPFDKEYWAKKKAEEKGISVSEIKKEWQEKSDKANDLGTRVHKWIEDFWSGEIQDIPNDDPTFRERIEKFNSLYEIKLKNLVSLGSEVKIFSRRWKLSGTMDQPFLMWDQKQNIPLILIGDWKTNGEFRSDDHPKGKFKKLLHPFSNLYENHHNEYSIQISLYRLILEDEIGLETHGGFLCHLGPDDPPKIYPVKDLRDPLRLYLNHNRLDSDIFSI
jgi:hypothetical protein